MNKLCECGCLQEVTKPENRFLHGHYLTVYRRNPMSEATKKKMHDTRMAKPLEERLAWGKRLADRRTELWKDSEWAAAIRKSMSESHKGQVFSEEWRKNLSIAAKKRGLGILIGQGKGAHRRKKEEKEDET